MWIIGGKNLLGVEVETGIFVEWQADCVARMEWARGVRSDLDLSRPCWCLLVVCSVTQWCLTLSSPMDCSSLGSSVHGFSQARILEWVAILQGIFPTQGLNLHLLQLLPWQADCLPLHDLVGQCRVWVFSKEWEIYWVLVAVWHDPCFNRVTIVAVLRVIFGVRMSRGGNGIGRIRENFKGDAVRLVRDDGLGLGSANRSWTWTADKRLGKSVWGS